jgi:hypothetical protein
VLKQGLDIKGFEVDAYDSSKEAPGERFEPLVSS